jgi:hypothetical protein
MAWLETYTSDNKITDEYTAQGESLSYTVSAEEDPVTYERTVVTSKYRYVGMTEATAITAQAALNAPPDTVATMRRENDGGAYMVEVTTVTRTAWALQTTTTTTTT